MNIILLKRVCNLPITAGERHHDLYDNDIYVDIDKNSSTKKFKKPTKCEKQKWISFTIWALPSLCIHNAWNMTDNARAWLCIHNDWDTSDSTLQPHFLFTIREICQKVHLASLFIGIYWDRPDNTLSLTLNLQSLRYARQCTWIHCQWDMYESAIGSLCIHNQWDMRDSTLAWLWIHNQWGVPDNALSLTLYSQLMRYARQCT